MKHRATTLIETIMVIFIFTLALVAISTFIVNGYRTYKFNFEQIVAISEARKGIETMVKEIREAKTGDNGAYALIQAGDFEFIFYGDIDKDSQTERVRYFLDGSNFKKGVIDPTGDPPEYLSVNEIVKILSRYVRNDSVHVFIYYNGDWPADTINNPLPTLTRLADTKLMHVYLKINVDPNRPPLDFELESDTQIRNLKTNL